MMGALLLPGLLIAAAWFLAEAPSQAWARRLDLLRGTASPGRRQEAPERQDGTEDEALLLELSGALLEAGLGIGRCLQILSESSTSATAARLRGVASALAMGATWDGAWSMTERGGSLGERGSPPQRQRSTIRLLERFSRTRARSFAGLRHYLGFAALSGAPAAGTLYAGAAAERRRRHREERRRAAALGVRLVLPLGLCSLPSFVCLGIIPVVLALLPGGV